MAAELDPTTKKPYGKAISKEMGIEQCHVGEVAEIDDKKLKFKIDCWLMPIL